MGPSVALAPLVSWMVVRGVVINSTAIAAGAVMSTRANAVTDMILKEKPNTVFNKTERLKPGRRFLVVTGGLDDGPVKIEEVKGKDKKFEVKVWKPPLSNKTLKKAGVLVDDGKEDEAGLVDGENASSDKGSGDCGSGGKTGYRFEDLTKSLIGKK